MAMQTNAVETQVEKPNWLLNALFGAANWGGVVKILPGFLLSVAIMLVAIPLTNRLGAWVLSLQGIDPTGKSSPISAVLTAIVIGILLRNLLPLPKSIEAGIQFSTTKILRLGIILVGIKLSLLDVFKLGVWGIPVVAAAIFGGLIFIAWINRRLNLPERLGTLIAAGTGICGVTAIVSVAPAIKAEQKEVAYAVANITLFGLLGMFLYPYLAPHILHTSEQIGLFLGTAVHETSQVVGAALTYKEVFNDEAVLKAATVTKLTRNLFLAVVVPLLAYLYLRNHCQAPACVRVGLYRDGDCALHRRCTTCKWARLRHLGRGRMEGVHQSCRRDLGFPCAGHGDGGGRLGDLVPRVQGRRVQAVSGRTRWRADCRLHRLGDGAAARRTGEAVETKAESAGGMGRYGE
jgi:uncharacterized integral membrane protein (TIGR00698 family)